MHTEPRCFFICPRESADPVAGGHESGDDGSADGTSASEDKDLHPRIAICGIRDLLNRSS